MNNPLLPKELPDDATFWELLKEQVRHDFAPILILLPAPFKRFAAEKLAQLASQVFKFGYGAIEPMIAPFCFLLNIAGGVVRAAGENILDLSETIKTFKESRQQSSTTKEGQLKTNSVLTQDDGEHSPFDSEEIRDNSSQERETEVSPAWVGKANSFTEQDVETGEVIEL